MRFNKPSVAQNNHPNFITHVVQLSDLNKCTHLVDIIQTCYSLCFIAIMQYFNGVSGSTGEIPKYMYMYAQKYTINHHDD